MNDVSLFQLVAGGSVCVSNDFVTCYGLEFSKYLLFAFALLGLFIARSRQKVFIVVTVLFFASVNLPLDVFAFWFFTLTLVFVIVDSFWGAVQ